MDTSRSRALRVSRVGVFASLYVATSLVPVSVFIGASSMLSLNLVITPAIAVLLSPVDAGFVALIGGLLALWIAPGQAIFGVSTVLLPVAGAVFGSLAFHRKKIGSLVAGAFLFIVGLIYLSSRCEFPYWITPHFLATVLAAFSTFLTPKRIRIPMSCFIATMCEQAAMLVQAVFVLQLPAIVFATAFPLMLYERFVGTIGASLIALGCARFAPNYFERLSS